jgi:hypothetical protein
MPPTSYHEQAHGRLAAGDAAAAERAGDEQEQLAAAAHGVAEAQAAAARLRAACERLRAEAAAAGARADRARPGPTQSRRGCVPLACRHLHVAWPGGDNAACSA